jgi:hypothetical protein
MIGIGIRIGGRRGGGLLPETNSVLSRFEISLENENKSFLDTLIKTIKDGGVWDKLHAFYNFWIHDEQACRINYISDTEPLTLPYDGTLMQEPIFEIADGIYGSGIIYSGMFIMDSYLDEIVSSGNFSFGYHQLRANVGAGGWIYGCNDATLNTLVWLPDTNTIRIYESATSKDYVISGYPATIGVNIASDKQELFENGVSVGTKSRVAGAVPHAKIGIIGRNDNGYYGASGSIYHSSLFYLSSTKLTENEHKIISDAHAVWRSNFIW